MVLSVNVVIDYCSGSNGGWAYRSDDSPVFAYKFNISNNAMTKEIPFQMAVDRINSGVTASTTLKLGRSLCQ